jgi:hypothetical protein
MPNAHSNTKATFHHISEDPIDENEEDVVINDDTPAGSSDDVQTAAEVPKSRRRIFQKIN